MKRFFFLLAAPLLLINYSYSQRGVVLILADDMVLNATDRMDIFGTPITMNGHVTP